MKIMQIILVFMGLITVGLLTCSEAVLAQSFSFSAEEGEIFMFPEMGAIIMSSENGPKVEMVMPPEQRDKKYKDIDLEIGDIIKMMNGKKTESIEAVQTIYDNLELEDEIKIAVMRGKKIQIVAFPKGEAGGNMVMQTMTITTDDEGEGDLVVKDGDRTMSFSGEVTIVQEIGLILEEKESKLVVGGTIPMGADIREAAGLKEGDQITALQNKKVNSVADFKDIYDSLKIGQEIKLEFSGKGTLKTVSFEKADAAKKVIMKSK